MDAGMADRILAGVREDGLLPPGRPALALLSGGRDSTCLLDAASRLLGPEAVTALHVNYGLRPGADGDEDSCAELCRRLGVELIVERAPAGGPPERGNLQAWARDLRYGHAARLALRRGAVVATGHTATDQAETILYRLAASPGRRALLGMAPRDGRLVRPLLRFSRAETAAACQERGLAWREDPANEDERFARARVRHRVLPAFESVHPAAIENVLNTAGLLRAEAEVLDELVDGALAGRREVPVADLRALAPPLRRLVLQRLADDVAGRPVAGAAGRAEEVLALAPDGGSGALDLAAGVRAHVEYGVLRMDRRTAPNAAAGAPDPKADAAPPAVVTLPVPGTARFGAWELDCGRGPAELRDAGAGWEWSGALDARVVDGDFRIRAWEAGDRMAPLGAGGSTTLADLFAARRVARRRRHELPIVLSGSEIAWIPGVATGERFRLTADSRSAVHVRARERA